MNVSAPRIAITPGEPAGIGPDICVALAKHNYPAQFVIIGDRELLIERARKLNIPLTLKDFDIAAPRNIDAPGTLTVLHRPLIATCEAGTLNTANAEYVLDTLRVATDGCINNLFDALVTGPVQKSVINDSGVAFSGHTEFLAERSGADQVVMMLTAGSLRVALATTHLPISEVHRHISVERVTRVLEVLIHDLKQNFGIPSPRVMVCGLNPHAGEEGHLGMEEIETITPVIESFRARGIRIVGPIPADTAFIPKRLAQVDAVLAMYHDQGLPVLKYAGFGNAVNITLGLPFIRTSVDHGTALELAGLGSADSSSLRAAIESALLMIKAKQRTIHGT